MPPRRAAGREALIGHFGSVADAAGLPVLVQDSPQVTGVELDVPTLAAMAQANPLVASLKSEIPGAGVKASAIHAEGLELVAGWGGLDYLQQIDRGAVSCFPGCGLGPVMAAIDRSARSDDRAGAEDLHRRFLPFLSLATASLDLLLVMPSGTCCGAASSRATSCEHPYARSTGRSHRPSTRSSTNWPRQAPPASAPSDARPSVTLDAGRDPGRAPPSTDSQNG